MIVISTVHVTLEEWLSDCLIQGDHLIKVARKTSSVEKKFDLKLEMFISSILVICESRQGN